MSGDQVLVYPSDSMSVTSLSPVVGTVTGGTPVTITGVNLGAVTGVSFGGVAATNVVVSPTTITAVTPAHAVGKVDVSVTWGTRTAGLAQGFEYMPVAPGKATAVAGATGNGQVAVSWVAPADTGGVPISRYVVTPAPSGRPCSAPAATTSCTVTGLMNGQAYTFTVASTNAAGLSSISDPSAAVTPVTPLSLKVKAKAAPYRPARKGSRLVVNYAKKPSNATRVVTRTCTDGTARTSAKLCQFTVSKTGKVKVRTKGYKNVLVTVSIQNVPKASAGPIYGPSPTWTRTWRVK